MHDLLPTCCLNRVRKLVVRCLAFMLIASAFTGCTAITNPVADGIPVRLLPPELLGPSKTCYQTIPLSVLRQQQPDTYRLDTGDVLGIFIDGFLGDAKSAFPVHVAPLVHVKEQNRIAPGAGYPIAVQEDGAVALPGVPRLSVKGMTVGEAREAIKNQYVKAELIKKENDKIFVTLIHQRQMQVLVFRQEATSFLAGQDGPVPTGKRNTGHLVDLPAYQNDVLHALARTGGLPELDAYNEIIIYRDGMRDMGMQAKVAKQLEKAKGGADLIKQGIWVGETVRIPMRSPVGAMLPFTKDDVILRNGDVIFLEARDEEVFYTAGILPPGKHMLPRDHDLDILEAISLVRGPMYNGAFGGSNLSGTFLQTGMGNPSPSLCVVIRRVPGRGQVPIAVDLRSALQHPQERLVIRPGDVLILQEKPAEAMARYISQTFFNFNFVWTAFRSSTGFGILDIAGPDRLPSRAGFLNFTPTP